MSTTIPMPRLLVACFVLLLAAAGANAQDYILLGWNDLGMHCANQEFSKVVVLPPFNNVSAQLLVKKPGGAPQVVSSGYTIEYSIPHNTYSAGKTNFWDYAQQLFGLPAPLTPNIGLTGKGLTGTLDSAGNYYAAHGIPITPFADTDLVNENPYQLIHLVARNNATGNIMATTDAVIPVSNEVGCVQSGCHSSAQDILNRHESVSGFNRNGPVLCASCHGSPALGTTSKGEAGYFSMRIHEQHSGIAGPENTTATCYKCHPGPKTQCLRDIMGKNPNHPLICQDCHGSMANVASTIRNGRVPWLNEPSCGSCHGANYAEQPGKLFRQSTGHGGLFCSACHGSPHAIQPTVQANDNLQNIRLQGYSGTLRKCTACHDTPPTGAGPHGIMDSTAIAQLPAVPSLLLPDSNALSVSTSPTLQWNAAQNAQTYHVELAGDLLFNAIVINDSTLSSPAKSVSGLLAGTPYFWRVRTKNSYGVSAWSNTWKFTTAVTPPPLPGMPAHISPDSNAAGITKYPVLTWSLIQNATLYHVQLATDPLFASLLINDSTLSQPMKQVNALEDNTPYYWRIQAKNATGTSNWSNNWTFTTGSGTSVIYSFSRYWNLVSLPLVVSNAVLTAVFPGASSSAYSYTDAGGYSQVNTVSPGTGYWLKFGSAQTISLTGAPFTGDTLDVAEGWNLIGSLTDSLPVTAISSDPPDIIGSGFFGYNNGYTLAATLAPSKGYWVRTGAGKLFLTQLHLSKSGSEPALAQEVQQYDRILIRDANGNEQTLYVTKKGSIRLPLAFFAMPPRPPAGIFDARFTSNSMLAVVDGNPETSFPIEVSSAAYPLDVQWEMHSAGSLLTLRAGGSDIPLSQTGSTQIAMESPIELIASASNTVPTEYVLDQNYPNPFNPTTEFGFRIADFGFVSLKVFDPLGREVASLVNEQKTPGAYRVGWDASNIPSGVYFYRLDAVSASDPIKRFSQTKKLILMK